MQKITKEDWDCIFNTESPDFEKKFNALVSKYIEKREAEIPNMDKSEQIGYRKGMDTFKYFFKYENWLTVLPIDTKIAFTEQGRKQQKIERGELFFNCLNIVGMPDDAVEILNIPKDDGGRFAQAILNCYFKLLEIQEERVRNKGIMGMIHRLL